MCVCVPWQIVQCELSCLSKFCRLIRWQLWVKWHCCVISDHSTCDEAYDFRQFDVNISLTDKTYNCNIIKNLLTRRRIHRPNNQVSQRPRRVIVKWPVLTFWKEDGGGYIGGGDDDEAYGDIDILKAGWIKLHWWWWCTENWNDMMRENGKQAWEKEGGCSWFTFQRGEKGSGSLYARLEVQLFVSWDSWWQCDTQCDSGSQVEVCGNIATRFINMGLMLC